MAPWAAGSECWLAARGYASWSVYHRVCLLSSLSGWLEREGLGAEDLTDERAKRFLDARRSAGRVTWVSSRCLALPLEYLCEVGAVPRLVPAVAGDALDELLGRYREHLPEERVVCLVLCQSLWPTTSPWSFIQLVRPKVPPSVPRSRMCPFCQR